MRRKPEFAAKKIGVYFRKWPMSPDTGELMLKNLAAQRLLEGRLPIGGKSLIRVPKGARVMVRAVVSPDWSALG